MKFPKTVLQEMIYSDHDPTIYEKVQGPTLIDTSRWSIIYRMVFKYQDKFYETSYREGATECQDENPYEFEPNEIECKEVFSVEKTIVVYE